MSNSDAAEPPREDVQQRESLVNYENAFSFFSEAHGIPCEVPGTAMDNEMSGGSEMPRALRAWRRVRRGAGSRSSVGAGMEPFCFRC